MKYVKGASKHEQAVPCWREPGAAPRGLAGRDWLSLEPKQPPVRLGVDPGARLMERMRVLCERVGDIALE